MGKPGKKAGKGMLPPTNVSRQVPDGKHHLRDQRTIKRLKMYQSKVVHDKSGRIVKGSVLSASDRVDQTAARIAPDRRWFGNTHVISQDALQKFRTEMKSKYNDPYSVVVKQGKLPLSLLEEPKPTVSHSNALEWEKTFGTRSTRKRVRMPIASLGEMATKVHTQATSWEERQSLAPVVSEPGVRDAVEKQKLYKKGQSNRIWNELYKVIDSSDVVLYVLDARDPLGTRSKFLEEYMRKEKSFKHFVFILNKCDLIPLWAAARWLQILSTDFPTLAFHASVEHPFGKGNLISLLRQFSRLHNVTHRGSKRTKSAISVGIIGYPNVGKSSIINTLRRKQVCKVAPIPGETKVWQYVALTKSIFLVDCPGVVYDSDKNDHVDAVLKGIVRIERLGSCDKTDVVERVLQDVERKDLVAAYGIERWVSAEDFCAQLAVARGKILPGAVPDVDSGARSVLYDWQRGKLPWFRRPPFESERQRKIAVEMSKDELQRQVEQLNSLTIENDMVTQNAQKEVVDNANEEPPQEEPAEANEPKPKRQRRESNASRKKSAAAKIGVSEDDLWKKFLATGAQQ